MRRLVAVVIAGALASSACGGSHGGEHAKKADPALPAPTPDTTPIRDLRTPAGIALGTNETAPPAASPSPGSPAPVSTPPPTAP